MKTKLYYTYKEDVTPTFETCHLNSVEELASIVMEHLTGDSKTVYLVALEFDNKSNITDEIYIHESSMFVELFISNHIFSEAIKTIYVQEYKSYEDAYNVALSMREGNTSLCYN